MVSLHRNVHGEQRLSTAEGPLLSNGSCCELDLMAGNVFTLPIKDGETEKIVTVRIKRAAENEDGVRCFLIRRSDRNHDEFYHIDPATDALVPGKPRIPQSLRSRGVAAAVMLAVVVGLMIADARPANAFAWLLRLAAGSGGGSVAAEVSAATALRAGAAAATRSAAASAGARMAAFATVPRILGQRFIVVINQTKFEATVKFSASATATMPILFWSHGGSGIPHDFAQLVHSNCANGWATVQYQGQEQFNWSCG